MHKYIVPYYSRIMSYIDMERVVDCLPLMTYGLKLSFEA